MSTRKTVNNGWGDKIHLAGQVDGANWALSTAPSADQDPVFDHANATKTSVTASVTVLTPAAGHKYARISCDVDCFVRTDGLGAAADDSNSIRIIANQPEVIPVIPATVVKAYAATTSVVRVTPLKARS